MKHKQGEFVDMKVHSKLSLICEIISDKEPYYLVKSKISNCVYAITDDDIIEPKPITYTIGNQFNLPNNDRYLLAQVKAGYICLISLKNGNRLREAIEVSDHMTITQEEFDRIVCGYSYQLVI